MANRRCESMRLSTVIEMSPSEGSDRAFFLRITRMLMMCGRPNPRRSSCTASSRVPTRALGHFSTSSPISSAASRALRDSSSRSSRGCTSSWPRRRSKATNPSGSCSTTSPRWRRRPGRPASLTKLSTRDSRRQALRSSPDDPTNSGCSCVCRPLDSATPTNASAGSRIPKAFREMVFGLDGVADQTQRHALLHLVHPDSFEDIVSQYHKHDLASLAEPGEVGANDDETIANIRARLAAEHGDDFSFYSPEIRALWQPEEPLQRRYRRRTCGSRSVAVEDLDATVRGAWLIRGSGGEKVPDWLEQGICAIYYADSFPSRSRLASAATSCERSPRKPASTSRPVATTPSSARCGGSSTRSRSATTSSP